ncbi:hypothetical protein BDV96DRAFT_561942, partial [Lophiotrema nucula]
KNHCDAYKSERDEYMSERDQYKSERDEYKTKLDEAEETVKLLKQRNLPKIAAELQDRVKQQDEVIAKLQSQVAPDTSEQLAKNVDSLKLDDSMGGGRRMARPRNKGKSKAEVDVMEGVEMEDDA